MNEAWKNRGNLIRASLVITIIMSILSMSVMLTYATQKTIIVSEDETEGVTAEVAANAVNWSIDTKNLTDKKAEFLRINIPSDATSSDVTVSARYDLMSVTVKIRDTRESYFLSDPPRGNYSHIKAASGAFDGKDTAILFDLDTICVCEYGFRGHVLELKFTPVEEIKRPIVVLDPGHGGASVGTRVGELTEKNVALSLAKKIRDLSIGKPYTVLLTREDDEALTTEERIRSIEAVDADFFLGIHMSTDVDDVKKFGMSASYNSLYYHNGLENAEFADMILKSAATAASNKALGVNEADDDEAILKVLDIPSAYLYAGFLSNTDEARLLGDPEYLTRIAQGIVDALEIAARDYVK